MAIVLAAVDEYCGSANKAFACKSFTCAIISSNSLGVGAVPGSRSITPTIFKLNSLANKEMLHGM